jgi:hypothetical protein
VKQTLKACSSKIDGSFEDVFKKVTSLGECVERHRKNKYLSDAIRIIFENYQKCIESLRLSNIALIISKCIDPTVNKIFSTNVINIITEDIRQMIGLKMIEKIEKKATPQALPGWFPKAGFISGLVTLLFFMGLVITSLFGFSIPKTERYLPIIVLSLGLALASSFLGGYALARGKMPLPFAKDSPIKFSVTGGIAVFIITFALGYWFYCTG